MVRKLLSDRQWKRIAPLLPGKRGDPGRSSRDNRLAVEGMLWIARTGAPWRDLPPDLGNWSTIYQRFNRWVKRGVLERIFQALSRNLNLRTVMIDGTFVKVHQHGTGSLKESARPVEKPSVEAAAG
jgi:transposase